MRALQQPGGGDQGQIQRSVGVGRRADVVRDRTLRSGGHLDEIVVGKLLQTAQQAVDQRFPGTEVIDQATLGDSRRPRNGIQRRLPLAVLDQQPLEGVQHLVAGGRWWRHRPTVSGCRMPGVRSHLLLACYYTNWSV